MCQKCDQVQRILLDWTNKQGHERCWYYPNLFKQLMAIYDLPSGQETALPPLEEFKAGCERYQQEEYHSCEPT